ncbi:MAG: hypothetical protein HYX96_00205 [Chloroflexi bacterium]|nr:hypothetical protein [Chloroflexota bacterium]
MKKITVICLLNIILLAVWLVLPQSAAAKSPAFRGEVQRSGGANLNGVWGSSARDVFAVGDGGTILRYDGTSWSAMTSGTSSPLTGIWGSGRNSIFAVGGSGTILRYDGSSWQGMASGTDAYLRDVWGTSARDVFAVGSGGTILHYDGTSWTSMAGGTGGDIGTVWGSSPSNVLATANLPMNLCISLHYDGSTWEARNPWSGDGEGFTPYMATADIWGTSARDFFVAGWLGIAHYRNGRWNRDPGSGLPNMMAVWGNSRRDVFAAGFNGAVAHYDGAWSPLAGVTSVDLRAVWSSRSEVFAVGEEGTIVRYRR